MSKTLEAPTNYFPATLAVMGRGKTAEELAQKVSEVTAAVLETGKPGTVTLSLTIKPVQGSTTQVTVVDKVTPKKPVVERGTIFFINRDGGLSRDDPEQLALFEDP